MSFYRALFGGNSNEDFVNTILGEMGVDEPGRYRDAWIEYDEDEKEPIFVLLSRTGGGNREEYEDINEIIGSHSACISDIDSEFDSTYNEFRFKVPDKYKDLTMTKYMDAGGKCRDLSAEFQQKLDKVRNMSKEDLEKAYPELTKTVKDIVDKVKK